jgi:hypothetical protein
LPVGRPGQSTRRSLDGIQRPLLYLLPGEILAPGFNRPIQSQAVNWATAGLQVLADLRVRRCLPAPPAARRRPKAGGKAQTAGIFERPGEEARRRTQPQLLNCIILKCRRVPPFRSPQSCRIRVCPGSSPSRSQAPFSHLQSFKTAGVAAGPF